MVLGIFKEDKNGNIRLTSRLYVDPLGREVFTLWGGDPGEAGEVGVEQREKLQAFRLEAIEALAMLGYLRAKEETLKEAVVREQLEREAR